MKPAQDKFTSHIQGLYDGHEVAPPEGMKDSVFNQLNSEVSGSSGLTSKAILVAAVVVVGFAWFFMPEKEAVAESKTADEQVVVSEQAEAQEIQRVKAKAEKAAAAIASAIEAGQVDEIDEAVVVKEAVVEVVTAKTESVEVEENIVLSEDVLSEDVLSEEEATPPAATVQKDIEEQKTIEKVEEKKETLEWVIPAKLKVDE